MEKSNRNIPLDEAVDVLWETHCEKNIDLVDGAFTEALVQELSSVLVKSALVKLAKRFSYGGGDPLPKMRNIYQSQGHLTLDQAHYIRKWKTPRGARKFYRCNSELSVVTHTALAARAADRFPDRPDFPVSILALMQRVAVPSASAFLTVWNPDEFGILDVRVWSALAQLTNKIRPKSANFTPSDFHFYTMLIRRWCHVEGIPARMIDKSLWQFDKERCSTTPRCH